MAFPSSRVWVLTAYWQTSKARRGKLNVPATSSITFALAGSILVSSPRVPFVGCPIPSPTVTVVCGVRPLRVRSHSPLPTTVTD
jgi:hypothetical protein